MSGFRKNTKKTFTQKDTRSFYLVASDLFYGLVFSSNQNYTYKINRNLVTNPNFIFYDNQSKVLIDYSNSKNDDDLSFIQSFFNSLTSGVTFEYKNATYIEDGSNIKANLSGIYKFSSFEQSKIVRAEKVSTTNINSQKDSYFSKFFTKPPQLFKSSGQVSSVQQAKNIIKNTLSNGLYSFERMGVRINDYIEFTGINTNSNKKLKVLNVFKDSDGFEAIQVDQTIQDENLIGQPVLVNLYLTGESELNVSIDEKTYGSCIIYLSEGNSICIPCQNSFLCDERKKQLNSTFSTYIENTMCSDTLLISNIENQTGITQASVIQQTEQIENTFVYTRPKSIYKTAQIKNSSGSLVDTKTNTSELQTTKNITLKIILSDPSLLGFKFIFSSSNPSIIINEIKDNVSIVGTAGTSSSYSSIKTGLEEKIIYLVSTDRRLSIPINIK